MALTYSFFASSKLHWATDEAIVQAEVRKHVQLLPVCSKLWEMEFYRRQERKLVEICRIFDTSLEDFFQLKFEEKVLFKLGGCCRNLTRSRIEERVSATVVLIRELGTINFRE